MNCSNRRRKKKINIFYLWLVALFITGFFMGQALNHDSGKYQVAYAGAYEQQIKDWENGNTDSFIPSTVVPLDTEIQSYIYFLCDAYAVDGLDYPLVMAVIEQESRFDADVISATNDYGLMQINAINHDWLSKQLNINDFNDPYQNIKAGVFVLKNLFEKYQDTNKVLMAYNMGETAANKLWNQAINKSYYSTSVIEKSKKYEVKEGEIND